MTLKNQMMKMKIDYKYKFGRRTEFGSELPVITDFKQRFYHLYMIGKTGMGKSSLLEHLIQQDLDAGHPVVFIDPKGDSANKLYNANKDKHSIKYVSFNQPIPINPLNKPEYSRDTIANEFTEIVNILMSETTSNIEMTSRMQTIMRHMVKGLKDNDMTIQMIIKLLNDESERDKYNFGKSIESVEFFDNLETESKKRTQKYNNYVATMSSIFDRLSAFATDDDMKQFLTGENEFDVKELINNKTSLFVDTSLGSYNNKIFLSNLIVYGIISYIRLKSDDNPLFVYIDEFHSCASKLFSSSLKVSRSKKIGFILAHQDFNGIKEDLLDSIIGNASSYITFRAGDVESKRLANIFRIKDQDIMDLDEYNAYLKSGKMVTKFMTLKPLQYEYIPEDVPLRTNYNFLSDDWILV